MREKYESLSAVVLKDLAKARGLKNISNMKKSDLIELMLAEDERQARERGEQAQTNESGSTRGGGRESTGRPGSAGTHARRPIAHENTGEDGAYESTGARARKGARETGGTRENTGNYENAGMRERVRESAGAKETGRENDSMRENARENVGARETERENGRESASMRENSGEAGKDNTAPDETLMNLDSGITANGILEVMPDGYGFIRCANYLPGENDVYVSPSQIRKFNLKTGDIVSGNTRVKTEKEKFSALLYVTSVNGYHPSVAQKRKNFEDLTPIFPNQRIRLEHPGSSVAMRIVDLVSPIGKGQRGMIVSQPKAGKTTLLKEIAKSVIMSNPKMHLIILLIDERPEEVTDIKEAIVGENVEVIYSTFDELPEHHKRVSEMVNERAKRLVEHGRDVMILLDSITRLARAYNLTVPPSGRTLSGGLDPAALHMPKRFFGAARNMREGGSLTILATALVDTGSKMDDVVFEEFKGTGNMELVLDRKLSEKRVFPAIDIVKSGTRRDDLLLDPQEQEAVDIMRKAINGMRTDDAVENILNMFARTRNNQEYINMVKKTRII